MDSLFYDDSVVFFIESVCTVVFECANNVDSFTSLLLLSTKRVMLFLFILEVVGSEINQIIIMYDNVLVFLVKQKR